jgi:phage-related protein
MISEIFPTRRAGPQDSNFALFKMVSSRLTGSPFHLGPGVREIRIHTLGEWRVIYTAKLREALYVLHAFQKKTVKTGRNDIELARKRFQQLGGIS